MNPLNSPRESERSQSATPSGTEQTKLRISIVVPFFNAERHIERCIHALLAQAYPSELYEIIMIDNNSTDRSVSVVRKYPRITLLSETKQGAYAARNRGAAASRGEIIAFTDADCVPSRTWLQEIATVLNRPEVALVQGSRSYAGRSFGLAMLETYESQRAVFTFSQTASGTYYGYTNNMAVRRDVYNRCGPFLELMRGADSIFVQRVISAYSCDAIHYAPAAGIRHLEISGVCQWLRKRFIYGKSFQQNYQRKKATYRLITPRESSLIFRQTIRRKSYALPQVFSLIVLLGTGTVVYALGRLVGRFGAVN